MAVRKNSRSSAAGKGGESTAPNRGRRVLLFLLMLAAVLAFAGGIVWLVLQLPGEFTVRNPRLQLRRVEVKSEGYWHGRERELELARLAGLELNGDGNLFALSPDAIRKRLLSIQNIESCEVHIVLPDTVVLDIIERVPRAVLDSEKGLVVVDEHGNFFSRRQSSAARSRLPVIRGCVGANREQALPALELLMTTIRDYPHIRIEWLSVARPGELTAQLIYREHERFTVVFPIREDYHAALNVLQSAILKNGTSTGSGRRIDLRFRGQAVWSN